MTRLAPALLTSRPGAEPVECFGCGQLLAIRDPDGGGEVVSGVCRVAPDRRVVIVCPRCGRVVFVRL